MGHEPDHPTLDVTVDVVEDLGSEVNLLFTVDAPPVETEDTLAAAPSTSSTPTQATASPPPLPLPLPPAPEQRGLPGGGVGTQAAWVLDEDMQRVVEEQRLGYVASVGPDGTPNLSPKGTTAVWDDDHLVFAHVCSPGTVANIEAGHPVVEVNVVDPIRRKGYRFKGPATVHREDDVYQAGLRFYHERSGLEAGRIAAIVLIRVERVAPLVSPAYDDGSTEDQVEQRSLDLYGLRRTPPASS